ncbi:hypothetical protein GCM10011403_30050 [Pseudohongiella nitratireducens]|jgi:hypothetical protein|uniref:Sporulation stage II protein D amidase enhancer LytB N-terminal domain-containing protein n=1 Tax=Pseudohongiella nitratireducens TaxID=1768907 RepID=A0A916VKC4_9GAMM|nr:hypothetical protein [Pseudohongiella nitratireducens]GFZ84545.1 hypothetical protein GCM10011403_30050 [Pseudohongiella nitratireducens]
MSPNFFERQYSLRQAARKCLAVILLLLPVAELSAESVEVEIDGIQVTLDYPSQVKAGENFSVTASLLNTTESHELVSVSWGQSITGSHASSYRIFEKAVDNNEFFSRVMLKPGGSSEVHLREFYYEAENLFSGDMLINKSFLSVSKVGFNNTRSRVSLDPIKIVITHEGDMSDYAVFEAPVREPLQRIDISGEEEDSWIIYDPNTGYEWLPLSRFQDKLFLSVLGDFEPEGALEEYRVANSDEVKQLFLNHIYSSGVPLPEYALFARSVFFHGYESERQQLMPVAQSFHELFGITNSVRRPEHSSDSLSGFIIGTSEVPNAFLEASVSVYLDRGFGSFYLGTSNTGASGANDFFMRNGIWVLKEAKQ